MGDLDNFFAKKDKKKKGTKGYSKANTEIIAKNLEEVERREQKQQEKEINGDNINTENINNSINKEEEDEEWAEYREKLKDYSVLKIESVRLVDSLDTEEPDTNEEKKEEEEKEKGDKEKENTEEKEDEEEEDSEDEKKIQHQVPSKPEVKSSYVPPHMRGQMETKEIPRKSQSRKMKLAPDISSEIYFPSLSNTVEDSGPKGAWGKKLEL